MFGFLLGESFGLQQREARVLACEGLTVLFAKFKLPHTLCVRYQLLCFPCQMSACSSLFRLEDVYLKSFNQDLGELMGMIVRSLPCSVNCRLEDVYLKALDLGELMDRARQAVVGHARGIRKDDLEAELPVRVGALSYWHADANSTELVWCTCYMAMLPRLRHAVRAGFLACSCHCSQTAAFLAPMPPFFSASQIPDMGGIPPMPAVRCAGPALLLLLPALTQVGAGCKPDRVRALPQAAH